MGEVAVVVAGDIRVLELPAQVGNEDRANVAHVTGNQNSHKFS